MANKWFRDHLFFWFSMALAAQCELKNADGIILASAGGSLASSVDRCLGVNDFECLFRYLVMGMFRSYGHRHGAANSLCRRTIAI